MGKRHVLGHNWFQWQRGQKHGGSFILADLAYGGDLGRLTEHIENLKGDQVIVIYGQEREDVSNKASEHSGS